MKQIAILMACYNRVDTTLDCLQRLYSQKLPEGYSFDVWLVDDASPDKTGEKVKFAYPKVNVIKGTGSLFWCKGMRLAWDKAAEANDYDFYLWLNDDVMLFDSVLNGLINDVNCIPEDTLGIIVGTCSNDKEGTVLSYGCREASGVVAPIGRILPVHSEAMSGNCVLIPKRVYEKVGPIYGGYSHAFGDRDYSIMLREAGGVKYVASCVIGICPQQPDRYIHLGSKSLAQRIRTLFKPKGFPLHDTFLLKYRHRGLVSAMGSCLHVVYRVVFKYKVI